MGVGPIARRGPDSAEELAAKIAGALDQVLRYWEGRVVPPLSVLDRGRLERLLTAWLELSFQEFYRRQVDPACAGRADPVLADEGLVTRMTAVLDHVRAVGGNVDAAALYLLASAQKMEVKLGLRRAGE